MIAASPECPDSPDIARSHDLCGTPVPHPVSGLGMFGMLGSPEFPDNPNFPDIPDIAESQEIVLGLSFS